MGPFKDNPFLSFIAMGVIFLGGTKVLVFLLRKYVRDHVGPNIFFVLIAISAFSSFFLGFFALLVLIGSDQSLILEF